MPLTSPSFQRWYDTHAKSFAPPAPKPPFGNLPDLALQSQLGRSLDAAWPWRRGLRGYSNVDAERDSGRTPANERVKQRIRLGQFG
jgi:hypothetical protein